MSHTFGTVGPALHRAGWPVIPVKAKTKRPLETAWQQGFSGERIDAFAANGYAGGNTGLLAKNLPGVDIDVSDKGVAKILFELALAKLGPAPVRVGSAPKCLLMYSTSAPFSKMKLFLTGPDGDRGPDGKEYAVEILGDGQQYLIYGEHPDGFQYRWPRGGDPLTRDVWDLTDIDAGAGQAFFDAIPGVLPPGWSVRSTSAPASSGGSAGADAFEAYRTALEGWGLDRVRDEVMVHLDLEMDYDSWVRVGQALYHQFDGADEAFELWDSTFQGSSKYTSADYGHARWRSFKAQRASGRGPVTLASLLADTKDARGAVKQEQAVDAVATHRAAIQAATTELTVREICARIASDGAVDALSRDTLVGVVQLKLRDINGVKPTKRSVEALVAMTRVARTGPSLGPEWVLPWCYVAGEARFFNRGTKELITREAFDASFGRLMEPADDGAIPQASRLACDAWEIPVVYERMYLPSAGELFTLDGREYANDYRPESEPLGVVDLNVNAVLMRHVELLIPDATYRALFLQWAAWVVRNPGKKVLWAILVKGVEGDGKSVFGSMIAQAMGHINVGIISPETMAGSNFNDWAKGRCVNVLEEIKIPGHRHDVYNKIKPLITNPRIEIHGKGKASTTVINTTNYIGFTNHDDALPLDDKDRRHFVLFTPWRDIGGLHDAVEGLGLTVDEYWDQLWDPIKNRPDAVRGFFDAIDISTFNPNSRAPATTFKRDLVAAGDFDDAEGHARFWVEEGCYGVGKTVVSSNCLTRALANMDPPIKIHTSRVRKVLTSMGFAQYPHVLKWKGSSHRVWAQAGATSGVTSVSTDWLRAELDKTDLGGAEDFLK